MSKVTKFSSGDTLFYVFGDNPLLVESLLNETLTSKVDKVYQRKTLTRLIDKMNELYLSALIESDKIQMLKNEIKNLDNLKSDELNLFIERKAELRNFERDSTRKCNFLNGFVGYSCFDENQLKDEKEKWDETHKNFKEFGSNELMNEYILWSKEKSKLYRLVLQRKNKIRMIIAEMNNCLPNTFLIESISKSALNYGGLYEGILIDELYSLCNLSKSRCRHKDEVDNLTKFLSATQATPKVVELIAELVYEANTWTSTSEYNRQLLFLDKEEFTKTLEENGFTVQTASKEYILNPPKFR